MLWQHIQCRHINKISTRSINYRPYICIYTQSEHYMIDFPINQSRNTALGTEIGNFISKKNIWILNLPSVIIQSIQHS